MKNLKKVQDYDILITLFSDTGVSFMKKAFVAMLTATAIFFSQSLAFAGESLEKSKALYSLGIIKGTGDTFSEESLNLDSNATKAEACTTIV